MKMLPLKFLMVFMIFIIQQETYGVRCNYNEDNINKLTFTPTAARGSQEMKSPDLEVKSGDLRLINHGEKVETIVVQSPASNYSEIRIINSYNLQVIIVSKKKSFLISHYCLFSLKTTQISPLVNILRI